MTEQDGFIVEGEFVPLVSEYAPRDPELVRQVTGLPWKRFLKYLDEPEADPDLFASLLCLLTISMSAKYPRVPSPVLVRRIKSLDMDEVRMVGSSDPPA